MIPRDPLAETERLAIADVVLSTLRHDVRNRFGIIRNASFYLRKKLGASELAASDPRILTFLQLIEDEIVKGDALLSSNVASDTIPVRKDVSEDGDAAVRRGIDCVRVERDEVPSIDFEALGSRVAVLIDADDLALAVRCVVENALDASPREARVSVRAELQKARFVISVTDAGSGIPAADRERIFHPFVTDKPGRAGLGLAVARRVIARADGDVVATRLRSLDGGPTGGAFAISVRVAP